MLRPSYTDLLKAINKSSNLDEQYISRYTIVISVAKRSRQLVDGYPPLVSDTKVDKPVSIAVQELNEGMIKVRPPFENSTN